MSTNSSRVYKIGIDARLWNETGVGRYIRNLVAELQKIDKENEYLLFVLSKDVDGVKSQISNPKFQVKTADYTWHGFAEQIFFPIKLYKENLDLVHFPYFAVPLLYRKLFIVTIHDLIIHHFPTGKASKQFIGMYVIKLLAYKLDVFLSAWGAKRILTVSKATRQEIVDHLHVSSQKIAVIYEGIDQRIKSQELKMKNEYGKFFLYVGNAYPHKNLEKLVEAFFLFHKENPDIKLILVGKEDFFYSRLEKKVKELGLSEVILFKHQVRDEELANLYKNALALVMPSLMEGFGLPVIEAMQQQCLVAISDIPVFHEIAKNAAIYFNPQDVQAIKNVLESIAKGDVPDESEKKKIGKEITANFSWKKMAEETQKVYKSCIGL